MATSYGPFHNHSRVWFSYSVAGISQGSTSAFVAVDANLQMDSAYSSSGTYTQSWSGYWGSGSVDPNWSLAPNESRRIKSWGENVALTDSEQSLSFVVTGRTFHGASGYAITVTVPARFALAPSALLGSRISDGQINLSWNRNSTYTSVVVQRSTDNVSWMEVGRPTGNVASFSDMTVQPNQRYYYRVAGIGGSGQSYWSNTFGPIYTSPAAPETVAAVRVSNTQIDVSATGLPPYATSYDIEDGGAVIASAVALPWSHVNPSLSVAHQYRVRGRVGSLLGA